MGVVSRWMAAQDQQLVLHVVPFSHPCLAVSAALDRIGREYETVELVTGRPLLTDGRGPLSSER